MAADLTVRGAPEVHVLPADFTTLADLPSIAAAAWDRFAGLDIALIAYGTMIPQQAAEQDPAATQALLTANFTSPAILLGELANRFQAARAGTMAAITSVAGDRGRKSNYIYGAAKGGLQRLLEGMRHRLAGSGVAVVDIRPGFVATRMTAHLDRSGPLWAQPDTVAAQIGRAIAAGSPICYSPAFWWPIMLIIRMLPRFVFHRTSF
jgi:NAD(P)-dependent dehydrogenase (short-subunit alcohol dehydrogenase family)